MNRERASLLRAIRLCRQPRRVLKSPEASRPRTCSAAQPKEARLDDARVARDAQSRASAPNPPPADGFESTFARRRRHHGNSRVADDVRGPFDAPGDPIDRDVLGMTTSRLGWRATRKRSGLKRNDGQRAESPAGRHPVRRRPLTQSSPRDARRKRSRDVRFAQDAAAKADDDARTFSKLRAEVKVRALQAQGRPVESTGTDQSMPPVFPGLWRQSLTQASESPYDEIKGANSFVRRGVRCFTSS